MLKMAIWSENRYEPSLDKTIGLFDSILSFFLTKTHPVLVFFMDVFDFSDLELSLQLFALENEILAFSQLFL